MHFIMQEFLLRRIIERNTQIACKPAGRLLCSRLSIQELNHSLSLTGGHLLS